MATVLPINQGTTGHTETATVQGGFGTEFMVHSGNGVVRASVAFSCLVTPEPGDVVLLSCHGGQNHILSILQRPEQQDMTLAFPANVKMQAKAGNVELTSVNKLALTGAEQTQITSSELDVKAMNTQIYSEQMSVVGDKASSQWREVNSIVGAFSLIAERVTQKLKNSFKMVEGVDQQTSQNLLQTIGKTLSIRSRDAVITARKDVKIDGERIHMG